MSGAKPLLQTIYAASDASLFGLGYVRFHGTESVEWRWVPDHRPDHIYFRELRAVLLAVRSLLRDETGVRLVLAVDNSAAVAALRKRYSATIEGRRIITEILAILEATGSELEVTGVPGQEKVADHPSRCMSAILDGRRVDDSVRSLEPSRIQATWNALKAYEYGLGKQSQNVERFVEDDSEPYALRHREPDEAPIPSEFCPLKVFQSIRSTEEDGWGTM